MPLPSELYLTSIALGVIFRDETVTVWALLGTVVVLSGALIVGSLLLLVTGQTPSGSERTSCKEI